MEGATKELVIKRPRSKKGGGVLMRGFLRGQLINGETGKVEGDSGWVQNMVVGSGLGNLANLLGGQAGSYVVGYAVLGTQNTAMDISQTTIVGTTASFNTVSLSVTSNQSSATATLQATCSFASSQLSASCSVAAAGLYKTNSAGSLIAGQTFATSAWNTNQNFNLTYQIRFQTA